MDRRKLITAAAALPVTLPLLPVSAFATLGDPAVAAYREWQEAYRTFLIALKTREDDDDPVVDAADNAERAAAMKFTKTVPTTLAGLAAQISFTPSPLRIIPLQRCSRRIQRCPGPVT